MKRFEAARTDNAIGTCKAICCSTFHLPLMMEPWIGKGRTCWLVVFTEKVNLISPCDGAVLLPQHPALAVVFLLVLQTRRRCPHGCWNRKTTAPDLSARKRLVGEFVDGTEGGSPGLHCWLTGSSIDRSLTDLSYQPKGVWTKYCALLLCPIEASFDRYDSCT